MRTVFNYDSTEIFVHFTNKFTGKERDAESGLDYFGAKYYGSALGRFTSPDEFEGGIVDPFTGQDIETNTALPYADITEPQTLNKYAYVRNNHSGTQIQTAIALKISASARLLLPLTSQHK